MACVHIESSEIPKDAIDSTETLLERKNLNDKIDEMTTETTSVDGVMKIIGEVIKKADALPAI